MEVTEEDIWKLLSIAMEIAVHNFTYTFDGEYFVHSSGGPIGSHLTMALARHFMQSWSESFSTILKENEIGKHFTYLGFM